MSRNDMTMSASRSKNKQRNIACTDEDSRPGCDAIVPETSRMNNKLWPSIEIRKLIEAEKAFNAMLDQEDEEFARKTGRTNYSSYKRNGKKEIANNKIDEELLNPFASTQEESRIDCNSLAADTAVPKKRSLLAIVKKMSADINAWIVREAQRFSKKVNETNDDINYKINYKRIDQEEIGNSSATCTICVERFKLTNYYAW